MPGDRRTRALVVSTAAVLAAACGPAAALAAPVRPPAVVPASLTEQVVSPHFVVHYTSAPTDPNATSATEAQSVDITAEQAYAAETGALGFPPPPDDGDGHVDIYIYDDPAQTENGLAHRDSSADTTSGWISINPHGTAITNGATIPHELFHLIQFGIDARLSGWDLEGGAVWISALVSGTLSDHPPVYLFDPPHENEPLDCPGTPCSNPTPIDAYRDWPFFEYLQEHYGSDTYLAILRRAAALLAADRLAGVAAPPPHDLQAFDDVLRLRGGSLSSAVGGWAAANLIGQYSFGPLSGRPANVPDPATLRVGATPTVAPIALNHFSSVYLSTGAIAPCSCRPTLHVRVTTTGGAVSSSLSVGAAQVAAPVGAPNTFDVVDQNLEAAHLAVTNEGSAPDNLPVTVSVWATSPPVPAIRITSVHVHDGRRRSLRLVVVSSAAGELRLELGAATKTVRLNPGHNVIGLTVPRKLKGRRAKLTLIPLAVDGHAGGFVRKRVNLA
jgi:hypothetical protein